MTSRWTIALASAAGAAIAAVAVITLSGRASDDATATVPDDTVPAAAGTSDEDARTITVSGHGTVAVIPDIADVWAGVQSQAPTAAEALDTIGTKSQALVATLQGLGIPDEDIQTSGLSLYPNYGNDGTAINGYQASTNVNITIREVDRVGEVIDALQGFVGEELTLGGISFSYDDPEAVLGEARTAAIDNARTRAEQFAAAADGELGEILQIIEGSVPTPIFARSAEFAADAAAPAVAIEPGSQDLSVDISVVFAMT